MNLLSDFLSDPGVAIDWDVDTWNRFFPLARSARLLGRCWHLFGEHDLQHCVPERLADQMRGTLAMTHYVQSQARWELREVCVVLARAGIPVIALKGIAYLFAGLPPADWRNLSDIDLLLRRADLVQAESLLAESGWVPSGEFDDYDQYYYRAWMHEVPPMAHPERGTEVDLHHNLAPPVSRMRIDATRLWDDARPVIDRCGQRVYVLSPVDMLLHNAVHLFMNDELRGGLRDVVDFRDLFAHFDVLEPDFERHLLERAAQLGCERALYYAVTTAHGLAGLRIGDDFARQVATWGPRGPLAPLMRWLIGQALAPVRLELKRTALARWLLFVRSHWVRMPPAMLARHLWHKAIRWQRPAAPDPELPG